MSPHQHVAIKVQRRKYAADALNEIAIHRRIDRAQPGSRYIVRLLETFFHDGHVCQVHELHGREAGTFTEPLPIDDVKRLTRQLLEALTLLHADGLAHTDVKPRNILWCAQKQEARLIDLGNADSRLTIGEAIATREYCPPEMFVGNPMASPVDLWSLACTVFELLTGDLLFNPWAVCQEKYIEFETSDDEEEDSSPSEDDTDDDREQLEPEAVLAGKYRLLESLGRGKFGAVWEAEVLHTEPLDAPMPSLEEAREMGRAARRPKPPSTGYDIYEVVLNYEHFVLMQKRLGPFPDHLAQQGKYHHILYGPDGKLRFHPDLIPNPIRDSLVSDYHFDLQTAREIEAFLLPLLQLDPEKRPTALAALHSPWLRGVS